MEGRVKVEETEKTRKILIVPDDGGEEVAYQVPMRSRLLVADGDHVTVGQQLIQGAVNPHEVLRILGSREVQLHLVHEVQEVYRSQGVSIHDKHIEIIIRQMLKRVNVLESGDTDLLPGELVERPRFEEMNRGVVEEGGTPAVRPAGADGHHQGLAGHRVVAVGGLVPGDHPGAHRRGDPRQVGPAARAEGERHHRQADPGRYRDAAVPQLPGGADRGRPVIGLSGGQPTRRPRATRSASRSGESIPLEEYDFGTLQPLASTPVRGEPADSARPAAPGDHSERRRRAAEYVLLTIARRPFAIPFALTCGRWVSCSCP